MLYAFYNSHSADALDFNDITVGDNGTYTSGRCSYDLASGIGTPIANELVPAFAGQGTGVLPGPLVFTAESGTNNFHLVQSGGNLNLYDNGTLKVSRPLVTTTFVQISGGTDNTLLLDYSGGLFTLPVTYDGGSGSGVHAVTLNAGTFTNETLTPTSATAGTIVQDSQTITFSDVTSITDLDSAINYTINGTSTADAINLLNGPTLSGTTTNELISGNSTFDPVDFDNKVNVTVQGSTGADTYTVNVSSAEVALASIKLDGGKAAGSIFNVQNIPPSSRHQCPRRRGEYDQCGKRRRCTRHPQHAEPEQFRGRAKHDYRKRLGGYCFPDRDAEQRHHSRSRSGRYQLRGRRHAKIDHRRQHGKHFIQCAVCRYGFRHRRQRRLGQ